MSHCNVIIYSYHYLLDPKIAERVSKELSKDCIVVFDEAHNIDNVCIESLSIDITEDSLRKATRGANNLEKKITEMRSSDADKLQNEYAKLVEGLRDADEASNENAFMANPGSCTQLFCSSLISLTLRSVARRFTAGSCSWQHPKSRTLRCISQTLHRIPEGRPHSSQRLHEQGLFCPRRE